MTHPKVKERRELFREWCAADVLDRQASPEDLARWWDRRGCPLSSSLLSQYSCGQTRHIWTPPQRCGNRLCSTGLHWKTLPGVPARQPDPLRDERSKNRQIWGFFSNSNIKSDTREGVFVISLINKQGTLDQSELTKEIAIMSSPQSSLCVLRWAKHLLELAWKSDTGHLRDRTLLLRMKG